MIWVENSFGYRLMIRAVLDSAGQPNYVTENLCQKLKAQKRPFFSTACGLNNQTTDVKHQVDLLIASRISNFKRKLNFSVVPKITGNLPLFPIQCDIDAISNTVVLADPHFHNPEDIDMLLGAEVFFEIIDEGARVTVCKELPPFIHSVFGYILCGKVITKAPVSNPSTTTLLCCSIDTLTKQVKRFWEIEQISPTNTFSLEEKLCEENYSQNVFRYPNGRYSVALPTKLEPTELGDSYESAIKQFNALERRFQRDRDLHSLYTQFLNEYEISGHMERVDVNQANSKVSYFLPHHPVLKDSSTTTKLRVVFNASNKTTSNLSLNDILLVGPTIQQDLMSILIRFRKHRIALTADIAKMYRQVMIHEEFRSLQQIVWRKSLDEPIQTYQLNTVTYGTASAPFLAIRTLSQLATDEYKSFPFASSVLLKDFYVDDLVSGADDIVEAQNLKSDLCDLLIKGGFELRKWSSNNKDIISTDQSSDLVNVLGMLWNSSNDTIQISLAKKLSTDSYTKRSILSLIAKFFDPLGLCSPVVFTAKCFLQKLWLIPDLQWDHEISEGLRLEWSSYVSELDSLNNFEIPRCIKPFQNNEVIELHGFSDASEKGFGCCVYVRSINENGAINCQLLCAKSKVAPLKRQTIPRLELCASLLLAQLIHKIEQCIELKFSRIRLWSDSSITLYRIKSSPIKYATFVANRIAQIQEFTSPDQWTHISTEFNPADIVSRGLMPSQIKCSEMWWKGAPFLSQDENLWPHSSFDTSDTDDPEYVKSNILHSVIDSTNDNYLFTRFSDYDKLLRVTALILLFVANTKLKGEFRSTTITARNIEAAMFKLIKVVQSQTYQSEIKCLEAKIAVNKTSHIKNLNPFLDKNNILRVGGRLHNSALPYDQKYPILIPSNHIFTHLLTKREHLRNLHAGPQALLCCLRQQFWIINGRNLCRKIVHECLRCFRSKPVVLDQIMGSLPIDRVQSVRAFANIGIDYCGPLNVTYKIRCKTTSKVYIAVFICFASKAVHLELVHSLTTSDFLDAFKRFVGRRGRPSNVYSDNATNFLGAKSELIEMRRIYNSEAHQNQVLKFCADQGIQWLTIPARSPHFGGLWESAVKSAKHLLKRVLGNHICTAEELNTLIIQIEACLNSRPLTPMSSNPSDLSVLTPGHLIIGCPLNAVPEASLYHLDFNRLSRFQRMQYIMQDFWKRWSNEYLSELQPRKKWKMEKPDIKIGTLVILKEDNVPPLKWVLGRVSQIYPGADNHVRVVSVKTATGEFRRSINKICILPIESSNKDSEIVTSS